MTESTQGKPLTQEEQRRILQSQHNTGGGGIKEPAGGNVNLDKGWPPKDTARGRN